MAGGKIRVFIRIMISLACLQDWIWINMCSAFLFRNRRMIELRIKAYNSLGIKVFAYRRRGRRSWRERHFVWLRRLSVLLLFICLKAVGGLASLKQQPDGSFHRHRMPSKRAHFLNRRRLSFKFKMIADGMKYWKFLLLGQLLFKHASFASKWYLVIMPLN
jgi:hypothetical protein